MQWHKNLESLREFVSKNNRLPSLGESKLGAWCNTQRTIYKGMCEGQMTPEKLSLLESVPGWWWKNNRDEQWNNNLDLLRKFISSHRRYPRQQYGTNKEIRLGHWCNRQRNSYFGRGGRMKEEWKVLLESIPGWRWDQRKNRQVRI